MNNIKIIIKLDDNKFTVNAEEEVEIHPLKNKINESLEEVKTETRTLYNFELKKYYAWKFYNWLKIKLLPFLIEKIEKIEQEKE